MIKLRIAINILLIFLVVSIVYILGFIRTPFLFITFIEILSYLIIFYLLKFTINLICKLFSINKSNSLKIKYYFFKLIVLLFLIFFILLFNAINRYWQQNFLNPIPLLVNTGIWLFITFILWNLIKPNKKKIKVTSIVMIIFIISFMFFVYISSKKNDQIEVSQLEALKSIPYLAWVPEDKKDNRKSGVTLYDKKYCYKGINIYSPRHHDKAYLLDTSGNILHSWSSINSKKWGTHIEVCNNGDLLVFDLDKGLVCLDWNSNIKWTKKMMGHHDIAIAENKDIYAISSKDEIVFKYGLPLPIRSDYITILSPDGKIKKEISLYKVKELKKEISFARYVEIYKWLFIPNNPIIKIAKKKPNLIEIVKRGINNKPIIEEDSSPDIFHTNTVEIIERDIDGLCKKGDLLISVRNINIIGILNIKNNRIIWSWGPGYLERQHHPTLLENGNILVFDNGSERKYSRIFELNPLKKDIEWEYTSDPPESFYSSWGGANQRLPNGNTLITESANGYVFEITKEGKIVWEFYNPIKDKNGKRKTIYRMIRITNIDKYHTL